MAPEERQVLMGEMKMFLRRRVVWSRLFQGASALAAGALATGGAGGDHASLAVNGGRLGAAAADPSC